MVKTNLKGLSIAELERFVESIGERSYRARQIFQALYRHGVQSFEEMVTLPKDLRARLADVAALSGLTVIRQQQSSSDATTKFLFELSDGLRIESVLIPPRRISVDSEKRLTVCVSTQVGCPLDCAFCATASMGFLRNLSAGEIIEQVLTIQRYSPKPITNVVFMGMGEPMLNYDNVMTSVEILGSDLGKQISPRRITVSTAGYVEQIKRMGEENRKAKLAISLHSLNNEIRTMLMPITRKHPVDDVLNAVEYYWRKTKKSVMLEYILFDGLNDTEHDVRLLAKTTRRFNCRVNLIPFHSTSSLVDQDPASRLKGTSRENIVRFSEQLRKVSVPVFIRDSAGQDIAAACGQLAVTTPKGQRYERKHRS